MWLTGQFHSLSGQIAEVQTESVVFRQSPKVGQYKRYANNIPYVHVWEYVIQLHSCTMIYTIIHNIICIYTNTLIYGNIPP